MTKALLNRGILSYKAGRYPDAIADLRNALETATDRESVGRVHYNLALAYMARGDRSSARTGAEQAVANGDEDARRLIVHLQHDR